MKKELNNKSLAFGVPGILIQSIFVFINPLVALLGTVLLIIGLVYYAKAKGHSGYFGLFGVLGIFGFLVLIPLKDRYPNPEEELKRKITKPKNIILGILFGLALVIGIPLILAIIFSFFVK